MQQTTDTEPNEAKSLELKKILLEILSEEVRAPIKMIESISGNRKVKIFLYNFTPCEFEPEYSYSNTIPNEAFEGSADPTSYKIDIESGEKISALSIGNPLNYQATLFIANVINFEL